jgi:putative ABC transport system permease protein
MNLSTAQAFERAKEVCYRKICGATQLQLVTQHMIESIITYAVALAISIILFFLVLTHVSEFVGKDLWSFDMGLELTYWGVFFVSFIILITPISIYMNVLLSSFKTTNVLIGSFEFSKSSARFRNALIVVQIFLSTLFIFQSLVISDQLKYMASYDSGIDMEHVLVSYGPPTDSDVSVNKVKLFSDQLKELAAVEDVTTSKSVPGYDRLLGTTSGVIIESLSSPGNVKLISAPFYATMTDINYIDFLNAEVIAGRNFNENDWDSTAILNETAVKTLGFESPLSSIDHVLKVGPFEGRRVIGVVKDFNQTSLQKKIGNYVYLPSKKAVNRILIRLRSNSPKQTVSEVQQIWSSIFSDTNFDYFFLDDHFNNQYLADEKLGKVLRWGSWLAILLTSIGIFSASTHSIKQRYREIGIRRVLGATITSIQFIFLKFYAYLICLALVVGIPVSFFISFNWLDSYAYRINLGLVYVVIPTIVIMLVTFMTIGYKVFMASKMNPVETIRSAN